MEAIVIANDPAINLLVEDTDDTNNPVLEVQASIDNRQREDISPDRAVLGVCAGSSSGDPQTNSVPFP